MTYTTTAPSPRCQRAGNGRGEMRRPRLAASLARWHRVQTRQKAAARILAPGRVPPPNLGAVRGGQKSQLLGDFMGATPANAQKCGSPRAHAPSHGAIWYTHPCVLPASSPAAYEHMRRARNSGVGRRDARDRAAQSAGTTTAPLSAPRKCNTPRTHRGGCVRAAQTSSGRRVCGRRATSAGGTRSRYPACTHTDRTRSAPPTAEHDELQPGSERRSRFGAPGHRGGVARRRLPSSTRRRPAPCT